MARLADEALRDCTMMTSEPMLSPEAARASWSSLSLSFGTSSCSEGEWGVGVGAGAGFAAGAFGVK